MNCSCVFHHHHPLHLTHLSNNNNNDDDYLHVAKQTSAEQAVFLLRLAKLLVLLLILLWLLLLMWRMIMREIMRMKLIKIRTTCNHQHHNHQVILMHIIAMAGLHHHLRYEIMTIFLN